jgi:excisionase family DNA binding protein
VRVGKASEVAKLIDVHIDKVYEMAQKGEIPSLRRVGPELRFDLDEIERWMREEDSCGRSRS